MTSGPKWSLRNGSQYQRLCARAGCGAPASVTLRFQPTQRQAWLVELDEHAARTQGDLCNRHAAALVLPRGWELHDERARRGPSPLANAAADDASASNGNGAGGRRVRVRRKPTPAGAEAAAGQLPGLEPAVDAPPDTGTATDTEIEVAVAVVDEPDEVEIVEGVEVVEVVVAGDEGEPEAAVAERVVAAPFGPSDDDEVEEALGAILDARTPLLQRAFRNSKPL